MAHYRTQAYVEAAYALIQEGKKASDVSQALLRRLSKSKQLSLLPAIIDAMQIRESLGTKIPVAITIGRDFSKAGAARVEATVAQAIGRETSIETTTDSSLLGGIIIQQGDDVIDASVKALAASLKNYLAHM